MHIDREQIVEELRLRKLIRKAILIAEKRREAAQQKVVSDEERLRLAIKDLISEAGAEVGDTEDSPHRSTGINVLEDLLKKIIPVVEIDYKKLTTSDEQRMSYVSHMLRAVENTLKPVRVNADALSEQDIKIDIDDDPEEFIDVRGEKEELSDDEKEKESFGIEGEDTTGRDMAFDTFKKIETNIIDAYEVLSDPEDENLFYDYLLKNMKLYFEKFEDELKPSVSEPEVDVDEPAPEPAVDLGEPEEDTVAALDLDL